MQRRWFPLAMVVLLAGSPLLFGQDKADRAELDKKLDNAMKGYNDGDHKKFFADFAKSVEAITTKQAFDGLYEGVYKKLYGKYKSAKFIPEGSVLEGDFLVLYYAGEFDKKKAKISVNFAKEDKTYKFMQIRIDEMKDEK